jgi:hypothetical protein
VRPAGLERAVHDVTGDLDWRLADAQAQESEVRLLTDWLLDLENAHAMFEYRRNDRVCRAIRQLASLYREERNDRIDAARQLRSGGEDC